MSKGFILLWMLFFHVINDYFLQGILASMKQKKWWEENSPEPLYKNDYIVALVMHALSWTFMIMLPIAFHLQFDLSDLFYSLFIVNVFMHAIVDHMKANMYLSNLISDQIAHLIQIVTTFLILEVLV